MPPFREPALVGVFPGNAPARVGGVGLSLAKHGRVRHVSFFDFSRFAPERRAKKWGAGFSKPIQIFD
jgi:hypothetical protein